MFSTFTTEHGTLIVRTQDIRRIEDQQRSVAAEGEAPKTECVVVWVEVESELAPLRRTIVGTAAENLARLIAEDQARAQAYAVAQQRLQTGLPAVPFPRGGKAAKSG